jgi:hypothetical protein
MPTAKDNNVDVVSCPANLWTSSQSVSCVSCVVCVVCVRIVRVRVVQESLDVIYNAREGHRGAVLVLAQHHRQNASLVLVLGGSVTLFLFTLRVSFP